jgi:hypothetical protein
LKRRRQVDSDDDDDEKSQGDFFNMASRRDEEIIEIDEPISVRQQTIFMD